MIRNNIYCQVSGMVMQCIADLENDLPVVLEIGCADGQGVARYGGFCSKVVCVDPMVFGRPDIVSHNSEDDIGGFDQNKLDRFKDNVSHLSTSIELVIGCSQWNDVKKSVEEHAPYDIIVIDGCHHPFDAVWSDFTSYYPFLAKGGFMIFDDLYEDCIMEAFELAKQEPYGMLQTEVWMNNRSIDPKLLQYVGSLKKLYG